MKVKSAALAAILSAFSLSSIPAFAVEEKPAELQPAEAKPDKPVTKKKVTPHSHAQEKTGTPSAAAPANTESEQPKKPLHDHGKVHK